MNEQTETIVWHKYPDEMPSVSGWYLVDDGTGICEKAFWEENDWHKRLWNRYYRAWATMPKGWVEK